MVQQVINRGTVANDNTGESPFAAFGKVNTNFTELYANFPIDLAANVTGDLPDANLTANVPLLNAQNAFTGTSTWFSSGSPQIAFYESDQGSDLKLWELDLSAGVLTLRTRTDADGAGVDVLKVTRGATTAITNVSLGNATNNPTLTWLGTGTFTLGGAISTGGTVTTPSANAVSSGRFSCTGTTIPTSGNPGIYEPVNNHLGFATSGVQVGEFDDTGQFVLTIVGKGLSVKEGSNAKMGLATLSGGTVVVSTTAVTANSRVFLTAQSLGTVAVPSGYGISARTAGTSFTILASAPTDTSTVAWMIAEPSP